VRRCLAAALFVLACAGCTVGDDVPALPAGRAILATPSIAPSVHVFGDRSPRRWTWSWTRRSSIRIACS
jgi:hypothetical protein